MKYRIPKTRLEVEITEPLGCYIHLYDSFTRRIWTLETDHSIITSCVNDPGKFMDRVQVISDIKKTPCSGLAVPINKSKLYKIKGSNYYKAIAFIHSMCFHEEYPVLITDDNFAIELRNTKAIKSEYFLI